MVPGCHQACAGRFARSAARHRVAVARCSPDRWECSCQPSGDLAVLWAQASATRTRSCRLLAQHSAPARRRPARRHQADTPCGRGCPDHRTPPVADKPAPPPVIVARTHREQPAQHGGGFGRVVDHRIADANVDGLRPRGQDPPTAPQRHDSRRSVENGRLLRERIAGAATVRFTSPAANVVRVPGRVGPAPPGEHFRPDR